MRTTSQLTAGGACGRQGGRLAVASWRAKGPPGSGEPYHPYISSLPAPSQCPQHSPVSFIGGFLQERELFWVSLLAGQSEANPGAGGLGTVPMAVTAYSCFWLVAAKLQVTRMVWRLERPSDQHVRPGCRRVAQRGGAAKERQKAKGKSERSQFQNLWRRAD